MASAFAHTFECYCSTVNWAGESFQKPNVSVFYLRVCWLWCEYFSKTGVISSNTPQVVHADSFPLALNAETVSQLVKACQSRSPALLVPITDVKSWIGIHILFIPTLIATVHWNRRWLSLLHPYQLCQPEVPCDLSTRVLSHGQRFCDRFLVVTRGQLWR